MGNATKVALVALLILMVVVVARFVREDTADPEGDKVAGTKPTAASSKQPPESVARPRTSVNPGVRRVDPGARSSASPTRPAETASIARQGTPPSSTVGTAPAGSSTASSPTPSAPTAATAAPSPASGAGAPPQSSPESRAGTVSVATVTPLDRPPPVPRTSSGEPLPAAPAKESGPTAIASDTHGSRPGAAGSPAGAEAKASTPGSNALVTTHLRKDEGGGGLVPAAARGGESGAPSYGELARAPESKSAADPARGPAPGAAGRASSSGEYPKSHEIVKGDSFWGLAQKYYGDGRLASLIEKENPGVRMQPGKKLSIPEPPARPAASPQPAPRSETREVVKAREEAPQASPGRETYVVQRGDTLGKIAMKFYGDAGKLELIEDANPHLKYQTLQAGAKIKIPPR